MVLSLNGTSVNGIATELAFGAISHKIIFKTISKRKNFHIKFKFFLQLSQKIFHDFSQNFF